MRKYMILSVLMLLMIGSLFSTITYSAITTQTLNRFAVMSGTTTVAVADTAANYILSPVFTAGYNISNKGVMIVGTVVASAQHTINTAVGKLKGVLQVSTDGTTFADLYSFDAYMSTGATAGTVLMIPTALGGVFAPYYRVKWVGYAPGGTIYAADIFGTIKTSIVIPSQ